MLQDWKWAITKLYLAILGAFFGFIMPAGLEWLSHVVSRVFGGEEIYKPEQWNQALTTITGMILALHIDASASVRKIARATGEGIEKTVQDILQDQLPTATKQAINNSIIIHFIQNPHEDVVSIQRKMEFIRGVLDYTRHWPSYLQQVSLIMLQSHMDNWGEEMQKVQHGRIESINASQATLISKALADTCKTYCLIERKPLNPEIDWTANFLSWIEAAAQTREVNYILFCSQESLAADRDKLKAMMERLAPKNVKISFCREEVISAISPFHPAPLPPYFFEIFDDRIVASYEAPHGFGATTNGNLLNYKIENKDSSYKLKTLIKLIGEHSKKVNAENMDTL